jgi:hypothetical protein
MAAIQNEEATEKLLPPTQIDGYCFIWYALYNKGL